MRVPMEDKDLGCRALTAAMIAISTIAIGALGALAVGIGTSVRKVTQCFVQAMLTLIMI